MRFWPAGAALRSAALRGACRNGALALGAVRPWCKACGAGCLPAFWREVFSRQNLLVLAAVLPVFYLYFSSNAATTMEEGRFCFYLSGRQEVDAGKELFELVRFYMLECGVYLALIWHDYKKDALFYLTAASLMAYPLFRMGAAGTAISPCAPPSRRCWCWPAWCWGILSAGKAYSALERHGKGRFIFCWWRRSGVGTVTALVELWHGFIVVWNAGHFGIAMTPTAR